MPNKTTSLKKNFVMNVVLTMSTFIFPLITFPYVSRILLPSGTGKVSFATSLISYFALLAQLGIPTYGIRACARVRDNREELTRTAHEILILNIVMCIFSYLVLAITLVTVPKLKEDKLLYIVVSVTLILNAIGMEWLFKALEQYTYIAIRSIIFKFVALIAMFLLIHDKNDYVMYGGISIFASSASNIFNLMRAHKYIDIHYVGNYNMRRHFKAIGIFFAMSCATTIYTHLDTVMLGFLTTNEEVGYYNAAVKIKIILVSIITSLGTVLLPRASYFVQNNMMNEFYRISKKALNFVIITALPMMIYFILFAEEGIFFLSGDAYSGSVFPMQIIMPTILFIGITNILGIQMLVPLGKEKNVFYSEVAGAIADIVLNMILIPKYASAGAAIGTLIAEFVVLLVQYFSLRKEVNQILRSIHYLRIIFALILGICVVGIVKFESGHFVTLVLSAILFFGTYGVLLLITKEEIVLEIVKQLMKKIKKRE